MVENVGGELVDAMEGIVVGVSFDVLLELVNAGTDSLAFFC